MRISLSDKKSGEIEYEIIYGSIAILALASAWLLPVQDVLPSCPFRSFTGIPCPTCGTTRSLVLLAHGDIAGSLVLNPLFSLAIISALIFFFASLARLPFNRSSLTLTYTRREGSLLRTGITAFVLANWIYLIVNL
jgi:hypothetical protein